LPAKVCLEGSVGSNGINIRREQRHLRRDVPLRVLPLLLKLLAVLTLLKLPVVLILLNLPVVLILLKLHAVTLRKLPVVLILLKPAAFNQLIAATIL
jgi:hypothetical protein